MILIPSKHRGLRENDSRIDRGGFEMHRISKHLIFSILAAAIMVLTLSSSAAAQTTTVTGTLNDGATYQIDVPSNWNGILFLYSHGYVVPGSANPATDVGDPATGAFMLASGFALAGSSYATTGWAIQQALPDQIAVLDAFEAQFGTPAKTVAWGHSLGGIITAGLIQNYPERFDAALPMCGVLAGGVATWNSALDAEFVFATLVAPGAGLQLVNITNPDNLTIAEEALAAAAATPQGQARIALAAAMGDTPGWFTPLSAQPARTDFADQLANQIQWDANVDFPFVFAFRAELEARAGGNPSWNTGVDYRIQLLLSPSFPEVLALYENAGLNLLADLNTLNATQRIAADPAAVQYLSQNIIFNGQIHIPVLTMHTVGDGLVVNENETAYAKVVAEAGNSRFLRQTFVNRAGHCAFTPAETATAVGTLLSRLESGKWARIVPSTLNAEAAALGPELNIFENSSGTIVPTAPEFLPYISGPYPRPFDALTGSCRFAFLCH
jgi:pimeloyl-ACP methyl ester carboxylesterase